MNSENKATIIFILPNFFLSDQDITVKKYLKFAEKMNVLVFQKVQKRELSNFNTGNFKIVGCIQSETFPKLKFFSHIFFFLFAIFKALSLRFNGRKVNYVISYDPLTSGLIGYVVSKISGAKLIIEVNGNYGARKCWGADQPGNTLGKIKYNYCQSMVPALLNQADGVKLLYDTQLGEYKSKIKNKNIKVFHSFVPMKKMKVTNRNEGYILLMGKPWHVKGIDLVIKAYNEISDSHDGTLKIVGYFPAKDLTFLQNLCAGNKKISIEPPVFYDDAQDLIDRCDFLVLPSRTEAMGRVLIEAMAHGKAVIGSNVDGIPFYVQHMENGLIFNTDDWKALQVAMAKLIEHPDLKQSLAKQGFARAHSQYSEESYLDKYFDFLTRAG